MLNTKYKTHKIIKDEAGKRFNRVFNDLLGIGFAIELNHKHIGEREAVQIAKVVEHKEARLIGLDLIITVPINFN